MKLLWRIIFGVEVNLYYISGYYCKIYLAYYGEGNIPYFKSAPYHNGLFDFRSTYTLNLIHGHESQADLRESTIYINYYINKYTIVEYENSGLIKYAEGYKGFTENIYLSNQDNIGYQLMPFPNVHHLYWLFITDVPSNQATNLILITV